MRRFLSLAALCLTLVAAHAGVVRPAPEFTVLAAGDKARSLKSFRGQPVVLVISDSAKSGSLKKQLKYLQEIYQEFASKNVVIVVALPESADSIPSNVPVALANNGSGVAAAYNVTKGFQIAIIGRDGNLDYQTDKVLPPERVRDVIQNSFEVQTSARKGL